MLNMRADTITLMLTVVTSRFGIAKVVTSKAFDQLNAQCVRQLGDLQFMYTLWYTVRL